MNLNLSGRQILSRFELILLITGIRAKMAEDRYSQIRINAHRSVISQINMITRWGGKRREAENLIELIEIPIN